MLAQLPGRQIRLVRRLRCSGKNDEQDVELADHDARITANTKAINLLEVRLTTAEGKIVVLRSDVDYLLDEVIDIQAHLVTVDQRLMA